jgi:hypothetical protein
VSSDEKWSRWIESGGQERDRVARRFRELEFATRQAAADLTSGLEKAGNSLKWGGLALLASAAVLRMTSFRRGFRSAKWLLSLAPVVARLAGSKIFPGLHPFGRRDSKKG